jgi:hypothetical protein
MLLKKIAAAVVFCMAALSLSAGQVTVKRLNYTIVLPDHPSAVCKLAGAELAQFLEKTYQQPLQLNGDVEPITFYVGVSGEAIMKGFSHLPDMRGKFGVFHKDRSILCHGGDDAGVAPEKQNWGEAGTLLAVYYFLGKYAGVGFYFPGEIGFSIQKERPLEMEQVADIASPSFDVRGIAVSPGEFSATDMMLFFRRSLCSIPKWTHVDTLYGFDWKQRFWESHPDYFLLRNGKRVWENCEYPKYQQGVCLSNPEVACQAAADIVEDLNANPQKTTIKLFFDAPLSQCQCERCAASVERTYAGVDTESCEEFYGFQKRVADIVHQSHPGVFFLTQAKNQSYFKPPQMVKLDDSFAVSIVTRQDKVSISDQVFAIEAAKRWRAAGVRTTFFGYPRYRDSGTKKMPIITPQFLAEYLRAFYGLSRGTQEGLGCGKDFPITPYSFSALNQFLQAKLLFDIHADLNALIHEFCAFAYPGAEKEMAEFYNTLETLYVQREDFKRDAFVDIYQPANLEKPMRLLNAAKEKVAPGASLFAKLYADFSAFYQRSMEAQGTAAQVREELARERENIVKEREKMALSRAKASPPPPLTLAKGVVDFDAAPDTWPGAVRHELLSPSAKLECQKTTVYLAGDGDFLYLGLVAAESAPEKIVANCKQDNSLAIFGDDGLEFLLLPPDSPRYYQIAINSAGHHTVLKRNISPQGASQRKFTPDRTFQMETKGGKLAGGWVAKAKISLAQFSPADLKKPWRFNVYRSRFAGGKWEAYGVMLLSNDFHQDFEFFPQLIFPEAAAE